MSATGIGSDLAGKAAGGRKLIAVVYADMVGYSRLIGLDDAGTLRRLRTLRRALIDPAIREHGGRVVQTGGDSLLVVFDSIDGAVRCAVKVQQQVPVYDGDQPPDRRIRFRVGINIGDVIAHGTDLHGDGVNIAARLEAECPVGGICVSRSVRDHVHGRLDLAFEPIGDADAEEHRAAGGGVCPAARSGRRGRCQRRGASGRTGSLARGAGCRRCGAAACWGGGAGWWLYRGPGPPACNSGPANIPPATTQAYTPPDIGLSKAPRLSIVVLPFENLSGDPKDDYLAEGITEDVTTDLSRVPGMFVIARESAYTYQGKAIDVRKVGEELGVRYVLEGSVRKLGDMLRVNAQLIATETGAHLWADRFDQKLNDLSAGQEEIVDRIGQTLNVALTDLESARSKRERPTNPDAFDLILRARSLALHPMGPEEHAERHALLEQALRLDPNSIYAMTGLADELDPNLDAGTRQANRARCEAHRRRGGDQPERPPRTGCHRLSAVQPGPLQRDAIAAYQRLLDEYPNAHYAYNLIGICLIYLGRFEEAIPMLETAIRRDPRSGCNYDRYDDLGLALAAARKRRRIDRLEPTRLGRGSERAIRRMRAQIQPPHRRGLCAAWAVLTRHIVRSPRRTGFGPTTRCGATIRQTPRAACMRNRSNSYQAALRLAGHRDHAEEDADFGVPADGNLHRGLCRTDADDRARRHDDPHRRA